MLCSVGAVGNIENPDIGLLVLVLYVKYVHAFPFSTIPISNVEARRQAGRQALRLINGPCLLFFHWLARRLINMSCDDAHFGHHGGVLQYYR